MPTISSRAIADAITRETLKPTTPRSKAATCFTCGRGFIKGDGRFCSTRCRGAFDAGLPAFEPLNLDTLYSLPKGSIGFYVDCANCHKRFDSVGWRCCSRECSRGYLAKQQLDAELADARFRVQKRKCDQCSGDIPNWRRGRRVRRTTRFCCARCRERYRRKPGTAPGSPQAVLPCETAEKCPENQERILHERKQGAPK